MPSTIRPSNLQAWLLISIILIFILHSFGQPWWCACGNPIPWSWDVWSSHNSQHLIDFYAPSHFLHGFIFFALLRRLPFGANGKFALALVLESAWEILENSHFIIERYRSVTASLNYSGDSILNSFSDLSMCAIGFLVASRVSFRASVAIFVLCEATTMFLIRDGLLLNILMLTYPIDAVRAWQNGLAP